jgi:hypothetical protein
MKFDSAAWPGLLAEAEGVVAGQVLVAWVAVAPVAVLEGLVAGFVADCIIDGVLTALVSAGVQSVAAAVSPAEAR